MKKRNKKQTDKMEQIQQTFQSPKGNGRDPLQLDKNPSAKKYKSNPIESSGHVAEHVKNMNPLSYAFDFSSF